MSADVYVRDGDHGFDRMSHAEMRAKMTKGWRSAPGTACGIGSTPEHSQNALLGLTYLRARFHVRHVVDAGAGDLGWIDAAQFETYEAFDLVPRAPGVKECDITRQVLPRADLIICRHVLNHLSVKLALDACDLFRESGSQYLLVTNSDQQRGYWQFHGLQLNAPELRIEDCFGWWLELHDLYAPIFAKRPTLR